MRKKLSIIILSCLIAMACDDEITSTIPLAPVSMTLDLVNQDHDLNAPLSYKTFTSGRAASDRVGYGGLLIINGTGGISGNLINLYAFDLACPVEAQHDIKVKPNDVGQAICPKCGAVYNIGLGSGNPESGSDYYLRKYNVTPIGNSRYSVTN